MKIVEQVRWNRTKWNEAVDIENDIYSYLFLNKVTGRNQGKDFWYLYSLMIESLSFIIDYYSVVPIGPAVVISWLQARLRI